jgi:hypothetical protein
MIRLFEQCDRGEHGCIYPDGGPVLDQPLLLLDAFAVIGDQKALIRRARSAP